jgi:hypothetical protein
MEQVMATKTFSGRGQKQPGDYLVWKVEIFVVDELPQEEEAHYVGQASGGKGRWSYRNNLGGYCVQEVNLYSTNGSHSYRKGMVYATSLDVAIWAALKHYDFFPAECWKDLAGKVGNEKLWANCPESRTHILQGVVPNYTFNPL